VVYRLEMAIETEVETRLIGSCCRGRCGDGYSASTGAGNIPASSDVRAFRSSHMRWGCQRP